MDSKKLENWVGQKLDDGIDPERIRSSLENKGYSPEIVDKVIKQRENNLDDQKEEEDGLSGGKVDLSTQEVFDKKMDRKLADVGASEGSETGDAGSESDKGQKKVQGPGFRERLGTVVSRMVSVAGTYGKPAGIAVLVLLFFSAAVVYGPRYVPEDGLSVQTPSVQVPSFSLPALNLPTIGADSTSNEQENPEFEEISLPDRQPPEVEGETVEVFLNERLAKPSRASIKSGDGVRFVNNASGPLEMTFESELKGFTLPVGKSWTVVPESITYYDAILVRSNGTVQGSIYVQ
ncbi:hypothetical protein [Candidatus Nanohalococcus occultus]|uniref:hypothetical protein n=1 Tax=Candidatus Nanohalococcus occultus TaxID=2978047 RepID=UPI0039DFBBF9